MDLLDRYELRDVLGTGAMGTVQLAWDPRLHREVAIKILRQDVSSDPKVRTRFQREARAVAALRHPNIVEIYDYSGEESGKLFIVMEKLEGDDLFNIVNLNGQMPEAAAAAVGHELCLALGEAHKAGIIHRDLKPENVFISPNGRVILTDFGIVKAVTQDSAVDGWGTATDVIGTPGFMPPELMMNKSLGPFTDVFALGVLLYNIATGKLPFDGPSPVEIFRIMMAGHYENPCAVNASLSQDFVDLLSDMLQAKPKKRMQTVEEARERLRRILANAGVTDVRDDLRDYMSDAESYSEAARKRAAVHTIQQIKLASKDQQSERVSRLKERLTQLDPDNEEIMRIGGIMDLNDTENRAEIDALDDPRRWSARQPVAGGNQTLVWVGGLLVVTALLVAIWLALSPTELPNTQPMVVGSTPVTSLGSGTVVVSIRGGIGAISIDGERLGRVKKSRTFSLDAGPHILEIQGRGQSLKRKIIVGKGENQVWTADLKRGKLTNR